jgi:hypothetical protein
MVPIKVDFSAVQTEQILWTGIYDLEPAIDSIGLRDIWLDSNYTDGWRIRLGMKHYGDKIALHKYDPLVTFFTSGGSSGAGNLARLSRDLLGRSIIDTMEMQIRNAFLSLPFRVIAGGGTGFSDIDSTDLFDPLDAMDVQLGFAYHEIVDPNSPNGLTSVAYASPGQVHAAQKDTDWVGIAKYSSEGFRRLLRYEFGTYKGVRYVNHPVLTLWNTGAITAQAPVTAAVKPGDGARDGAAASDNKVYGSYEVGQRSGTQTHYIQLGSFTTGAISDLAVGDMVTFHTRKSDGSVEPYDIVGGVLPTDGTQTTRQITDIDSGNGRITLNKPILRDGYQTEAANDCGAGEYAFMTKALHVHAAVIVGNPGAVVGGFGQVPELHVPPVIDDVGGMVRFSWDSYHQYGLFRTENAAVIFSAGNVMYGGHKSTGG